MADTLFVQVIVVSTASTAKIRARLEKRMKRFLAQNERDLVSVILHDTRDNVVYPSPYYTTKKAPPEKK